MAFMTWNESYSVSVREIDQQHRMLVDMLNAFYDQVGRDAKEAFRSLLDALADYAQFHFATEERYFDLYRYPAADAHIQAHRQFTEKITEVRTRLDGGHLVLSLEITRYLKTWLKEHIQGADRDYSKFFNEHGIF